MNLLINPTKRWLVCLVLAFMTSINVQAQRITTSFRDVSLSDALIAIDKMSDEWTVSFIYDELEDFRVTCDIRDKSIPDAVHALVGFYPVSVTLEGNTIYLECTQKQPYKLMGRLVDMRGKPVGYANIAVFDPTDTTKVAAGVSNEDGQFTIPCPINRAKVRISHVGYVTLYRAMDICNVGIIRLQEDTKRIESVDVNTSHVVGNMYLPDDYARYAKQVRKKVWEMDLPHFHDFLCPKELTDSAMVYLAKYDEMNIFHANASTNWIPYFMFGLVGTLFSKQRLSYTSRLRRIMVALNGSDAVKEWSLIKDYKTRMGLNRSATTVVGIRVIKPDGYIIHYDMDKYICPNAWNNRLKDCPESLPVKGLGKGDVIDLFWYNEGLDIPMKEGERTLAFPSGHPVLHEQYKFAFPSEYVLEVTTDDEALAIVRGADKYGNHLCSIERNTLPSHSQRHPTEAVLRYWSSRRRANRYWKKQPTLQENNNSSTYETDSIQKRNDGKDTY